MTTDKPDDASLFNGDPRRNEARWRSIVGSTPAFIAVVDRNAKIQYLNRAVPGMTVAGAIGKSVCDFISPEYHATALECIHRVFREGGNASYEVLAAGPHGESAWYETLVSEIRIDGEVSEVTLISQDVTERKRNQEYLETQVEQRSAKVKAVNELLAEELVRRQRIEEQLAIFKTFAEASGQGLGMADMNGYITYVNPAIVRLVEEDGPDVMVGKHVSSYYTQDYLDKREEEIFPLVSQEGYWQGEATLISTTGEHIPTLQTSFALTDKSGDPIRRGVVVTDLRRLKRVERSLLDSLIELQSIYESTVDGFMIGDFERLTVVKANQAMCEMLGYDQEELEGMSVKAIHPAEDWEAIHMKLGKAVAEEGNCIRADGISMKRKDGSEFYADLSAVPTPYQDRFCLAGFFRDVTERLEAERRLKEERESLDRMVRANDRDRKLITYEIHDGVAQQLLGALMHLQAYEDSEAKETPAVQSMLRAALNALRAASSEARRLMNQTSTPVLERSGVAAAIADNIDSQSERPGVPEIMYACDVRFQRLAPTLENAIFRIAQEAITNAIRHSGTDAIRVTLSQQGEEAILEVSDQGRGFDLQKTREEKYGLAGIRERAKLLGKDLKIESEPGQGTRIRVAFPLIYQEASKGTGQHDAAIDLDEA